MPSKTSCIDNGKLVFGVVTEPLQTVFRAKTVNRISVTSYLTMNSVKIKINICLFDHYLHGETEALVLPPKHPKYSSESKQTL